MTRSDDDGGVGHDAIDWDRLDRYFAGELPPEEADAVRQWLSADPRRQAFVDTMRQLGTRPPASSYAATAWAGISKQLHRGPFRSVPTARRASHWPHRVTWGVLAAAAVALCIVTLRFSHAFERTRSTWVAGRDYRTAPGRSKTVTLADGTQFTLAPASRLALGASYATGDRTVALEGEAFFTVSHDAAHPFSVRAGNAIATDIGTQFDVRAYHDEPGVRVAVIEGRVGLEPVGVACWRPATVACGPDHPRGGALSPGDVATVADTALAITHVANIDDFVAWTRGDLVFRDARLAEVAREIARRYDVDVRIADPALAKRLVTASLRGDSLDPVLTAVAVTVDAVVEHAGRVITFRLSPRANHA